MSDLEPPVSIRRGAKDALPGEKNPPQPVLNPNHTHLQIMFTNNSTLFMPMNVHDAKKSVDEWKSGSPAVSLRPSDGSAFHVGAATILFLRQVDEKVAELMVNEQNELNARRALEAQAQLADAEANRKHNAAVRDLQLNGLKNQLARGGVISG